MNIEQNGNHTQNGQSKRLRTMGGGLSGLAIRRPIFTAMVVLGLVVLGIFGYRQLAIDQFPDIEIPVAAVQVIYPGASSETMEREVSRRLEEAFNTVQGIDYIQSQSLEGVSLVIVMFDLDRDVDEAAQDIRSKIETIRSELPEDIEPPIVQKYDPSALPILSISVSSNTIPLVELTSLADETIRRRIEGVRGVGEVQLAGGLEREIRVFIQPDRMRAVGVSVQEVMGALGRQNLEVPTGRVEQGNAEQLVRITGRITNPIQFEQIIVANREGNPIRLKDVARVVDATEEERSIALVNDQRSVGLDILKVSGANTVEVAEGIKGILDQMQKELPPGVKLQVVRDNSTMIRNSVDSVIDELIMGALLTIIIVMLFLNDWKATLITSLALPVSIISTFILMNALGFTLNTISLMALALSIGILIDDAIVVIENIVRHREEGADHFSAARIGTKEIILAVMATTFAIVAVFVPVAFMKGIIGRFFYQFGITVAWAVLVSLFVSFTLTPMLSAWWGVDPHVHEKGSGNLLTRTIAKFDILFDLLLIRYQATIRWALRHRILTTIVATASFFGAILLFPMIGGEFMPQSDQSEFAVNIETPEGSNLPYTRSKVEQMIKILRTIDGVDYVYASVGAGLTGTVTNGEAYIKLTPAEERTLSQQEIMEVARKKLAPVYGATYSVLPAEIFGSAQSPLQIEIHGPDVDELQKLSDQLVEELAAVPGVTDLNSSMGKPRPEFKINVNREMANELGLDIGTISATVRPLIAGQTATRWEDPSGEEREVVVQIDPEQRTTLADLYNLPLSLPMTPDKATTLGQIANIERSSAPSQIDRKDLQRIATVAGNVAMGSSVGEASAAIMEHIGKMKLPPGYSITMGGETEQFEETGGYVVEALMLAVILIFLILASQFESLTQAVAIMMSLPLSLVGVMLALLITDDTLNMMSMIGVIMLMGLVTKNAILLVDNANEQRRIHGKDRFNALVDAGSVRFRPIMMTTLAMIFGMLPVALALGEGGGFRAPMARAVIGGLITSTLLTLIFIPVVYSYLDDMSSFFRRHFISKEKALEYELERSREHAEIEEMA